MDCSDFRNTVDELLESGHPVPAPIALHAETCRDADCGRAWEDFQLVQLAIRSCPAVESPELVDRVLAELTAATPRRAPEPLLAPPRRSLRTFWNLVTVAGVLVAAIVGLRPRPAADRAPVARGPQVQPANDLAVAVIGQEPFLPLHLAARAPALVTDTVHGRFDGEAIRDLPVVTPLVSAVAETFRPMGQELEEWVRQFQAAADENMDSTQVLPAIEPVT